MDITKPEYSIVIPVYYNEGSLKILFSELQSQVLQKIDKIPEIIFVDDGSGDRSFDELLALYTENPGLVKIIKLTRNFGQGPAVISGYRMAKGNCVITMSADLQDPPSLVLEMLNGFFDERYEIVICHRQTRDETWYRRATSALFYKLVQKMIVSSMPNGGFDFVLISKKVKDIILSNDERNGFGQAQILLTGYEYKTIPYHRMDRITGKSKWTFSKKLKLMIDTILSYSYLPIRMMSILGFIFALSGFIYAVLIVIGRIFNNVPFIGWAPIMILILMLSGIQMLMLGIIGEYLWRTLDQVRNRPQYIIEKVYE